MKKFFAVLFAFVMILSMSVTAFAAVPQTMYIDISQVVDSTKTVDSVYFYLYFESGDYIPNEAMTRVSDNIYSYPTAKDDTPANGNFSVFYTDGTSDFYNIFTFEGAEKDLYTAIDQENGTWSTYSDSGNGGSGSNSDNDTSKDVTASYTPSSTGSDTVSVDIAWGAMSFTYDDTIAEGETEENGWTCGTDANKVTVTNSGIVTVDAAVAYTPADGYTEITGSFDTASATLATNENKAFTLTLSGKPAKALDGDKIGSVTVTIIALESAPETP